MRSPLCALITGMLLLNSAAAFAQQRQPQLKTIPDSINFIWKNIERDFVELAEAMPEDKWRFKPTQGEFKDVRTFGEQVKHVACANEAWAKQMAGEEPPSRCDIEHLLPHPQGRDLAVPLLDLNTDGLTAEILGGPQRRP